MGDVGFLNTATLRKIGLACQNASVLEASLPSAPVLLALRLSTLFVAVGIQT